MITGVPRPPDQATGVKLPPSDLRSGMVVAIAVRAASTASTVTGPPRRRIARRHPSPSGQHGRADGVASTETLTPAATAGSSRRRPRGRRPNRRRSNGTHRRRRDDHVEGHGRAERHRLRGVAEIAGPAYQVKRSAAPSPRCRRGPSRSRRRFRSRPERWRRCASRTRPRRRSPASRRRDRRRPGEAGAGNRPPTSRAPAEGASRNHTGVARRGGHGHGVGGRGGRSWAVTLTVMVVVPTWAIAPEADAEATWRRSR